MELPRYPTKTQGTRIIYIKENECDIVALNETFLNKKLTFKITGYDTIRNDRSTGQKGGVAFLVKHGLVINKEYRNSDFSIITEKEALAINLDLSNNQNATLATIYCPNGNPNVSLFQRDYPGLHHANKVAKTNAAKAQLFAESVERHFGIESDHFDSNHFDEVNKFIEDNHTYFYPPEDPDDYRFDVGNEHELVADVDAQTLIKLVKFLKR